MRSTAASCGRCSAPATPLTLAQAGVIAPSTTPCWSARGRAWPALDPLPARCAGKCRWRRRAAPTRSSAWPTCVGPAARVGDLLCARAFQAAVGCVDAERGDAAWTRNVGGIEARRRRRATSVFGADASDRITAWRADNGDVAWTNESAAVPRPERRAGGAGRLGRLRRRARAGCTGSRAPTATRSCACRPTAAAVVGTPVVAGRTLLVVTRTGGLYAFRAP